LGLGIKSFAGVVKLLGVLLESSLLVSQSLFDFLEFKTIGGELLFSGFSQGRNLSHEFVKVDLSLDLVLHVVLKELGEIDLEFFQKSDALGQGFSVKGGSNFDESGNWVSSTELSKLHKGLSSGVWGDSLKLWDDDLKSVKDELGLFLSGEEVNTVFLSLGSCGFLFSIVKFELGLTGLDVFLKSSSSLSQGFDGTSSLLDLVGGMGDSLVEFIHLFSTFSSLDGVS
jgi:hypothetical protein